MEQPKDEGLAREIVRGGASFGALFNAGLLPAPSVGPSAGIHFQWKHFLMGVEGRVLFTPKFSVAPEHSALAIAPMGLVRLCYDISPLSRVVWGLEFCPILGMGALVVRAAPTENQPNFGDIAAHPLFAFTGVRIPVVWQVRAKIPEGYLRTYVELAVAPVWSKLTFNDRTVWGGSPPAGISIGVDFGLITGRPRAWDKPEPERKSAAQR